MDMEACCLRRLDKTDAAAIQTLFAGVFTAEPWNDDWSDGEQLARYIDDLIGQRNSLTFGLYLDDELIGLSMGRIKHWYTGTEYCIDELCISRSHQGKGAGRRFLEQIGAACKAMGLTHLFLLTEDHVPAFSFYQKAGFAPCAHIAALAKAL